MQNLFIAHGSTDHEACNPVTFLSAQEMAAHVYAVASEQELPVTDIFDNTIPTACKPAAIASITKLLSDGRAVFVGMDNTPFLVAKSQPISRGTVDPVALFCRCEHLVIDGQFIGYAENEEPTLTAQYLSATSPAERQAILDTNGGTQIFLYRSADNNINIDLRSLADCEVDTDTRSADVYDHEAGLFRSVKFLVSFAL